MRPHLATALLFTLAACGSGGVDENGPVGEGAAASLENAAKQAEPAAAVVMRNGAEQIEAQGAAGNLSDPNGAVQNVMERAGRAQVAATADPATGNVEPGGAPPSGTVQARPNLPQSPNRKDGTVAPDRVVVDRPEDVQTNAAVRPR